MAFRAAVFVFSFTTLLLIAGCKVAAPQLSGANLQSSEGQWHGPVKMIATQGGTEALFDPVESPGVYFKLTKATYSSGAAANDFIDLKPYVGNTITVHFQKQSVGILWDATILNP